MLGYLIKERLRNVGITQKYLSEKTKITPQTLNAMLNDKRRIEATEYFKICEALGLKVDYFKEQSENQTT